ncbi:hypothetical protein DFH27DRAFT_522554 [Peziza echinospora]|nr:hypothetical protein DFH27DRAFT_522554 [Peziza echinospora]
MQFSKQFIILIGYAVCGLALNVPEYGSKTGGNNVTAQVVQPSEFRDDQCGRALELEIPSSGSGLDNSGLMIGPPDYFCCDGWDGVNHSGKGRRLCCHVNVQCCNIDAGSIWGTKNGIKSTKQVGGGYDSAFLRESRNCGGGMCVECTTRNTIPAEFPGWKSIKRWDCATSPTA